MHDMKNMAKLGKLGKAAGGDVWKAFGAFNDAALGDGEIPKKYKELMAVAVALTTQCAYCIEIHKAEAGTKNARLDILLVSTRNQGGSDFHLSPGAPATIQNSAMNGGSTDQ